MPYVIFQQLYPETKKIILKVSDSELLPAIRGEEVVPGAGKLTVDDDSTTRAAADLVAETPNMIK